MEDRVGADRLERTLRCGVNKHDPVGLSRGGEHTFPIGAASPADTISYGTVPPVEWEMVVLPESKHRAFQRSLLSHPESLLLDQAAADLPFAGSPSRNGFAPPTYQGWLCTIILSPSPKRCAVSRVPVILPGAIEAIVLPSACSHCGWPDLRTPHHRS